MQAVGLWFGVYVVHVRSFALKYCSSPAARENPKAHLRQIVQWRMCTSKCPSRNQNIHKYTNVTYSRHHLIVPRVAPPHHGATVQRVIGAWLFCRWCKDLFTRFSQGSHLTKRDGSIQKPLLKSKLLSFVNHCSAQNQLTEWSIKESSRTTELQSRAVEWWWCLMSQQKDSLNLFVHNFHHQPAYFLRQYGVAEPDYSNGHQLKYTSLYDITSPSVNLISQNNLILS